MMRFLVSFRNQMIPASASETYEATGAGNAEVNGVYVPANLATYVGPPLYNKRGTDIYLFRWQRRTWVIATLGRDLSHFSEPSNRYYTAPSETPAVVAPLPSGWLPPQGGRGVSPASSAIHLPPPAICLARSIDFHPGVSSAIRVFRASEADDTSDESGNDSPMGATGLEVPPVVRQRSRCLATQRICLEY